MQKLFLIRRPGAARRARVVCGVDRADCLYYWPISADYTLFLDKSL